MQNTRFVRRAQAGFTIIELIVVIVILGILAAVAIPKFTDSSQDARLAVQDATLGALKTAWSAAYQVQKKTPSLAQVLDQMGDPKCTASGTTFTCTGVTKKASSTDLVTFSVTDAAKVNDPSEIKLPADADR